MPNPNLDALIAIAEAAKDRHDSRLQDFCLIAQPDLVARLARRLKRAIELLEARQFIQGEEDECNDDEVQAFLADDGSPPVAGEEKR